MSTNLNSRKGRVILRRKKCILSRMCTMGQMFVGRQIQNSTFICCLLTSHMTLEKQKQNVFEACVRGGCFLIFFKKLKMKRTLQPIRPIFWNWNPKNMLTAKRLLAYCKKTVVPKQLWYCYCICMYTCMNPAT